MGYGSRGRNKLVLCKLDFRFRIIYKSKASISSNRSFVVHKLFSRSVLSDGAVAVLSIDVGRRSNR